MAKSSIAQRKSSVTTNAMFKKPGIDATRAVKSAKVAKINKAKQRTEHELSKKFSASLDISRDHIYEKAVTTYDKAYMGLSQRLAEIDAECTDKNRRLVNATKGLVHPFKNQKLVWTSADRNHTGTTTLGHRMKKLQKTIDVEQQELIRQWDEWVAAEAELDQMATQVTVPTYRGLHNDAELEAEIKAEKKKFLNLMLEAAKASEKAMEEVDERLKLKQQRNEQKFLAILRSDDYYN